MPFWNVYSDVPRGLRWGVDSRAQVAAGRAPIAARVYLERRHVALVITRRLRRRMRATLTVCGLAGSASRPWRPQNVATCRPSRECRRAPWLARGPGVVRSCSTARATSATTAPPPWSVAIGARAWLLAPFWAVGLALEPSKAVSSLLLRRRLRRLSCLRIARSQALPRSRIGSKSSVTELPMAINGPAVATLKLSERRSWLTITARDSRDALARSSTASTSTSRRFKRSAAMSPVEPAPMTSTSQSVANAVASQATPTGGVSTKSCSTPSGAPY